MRSYPDLPHYLVQQDSPRPYVCGPWISALRVKPHDDLPPASPQQQRAEQ